MTDEKLRINTQRLVAVILSQFASKHKEILDINIFRDTVVNMLYKRTQEEIEKDLELLNIQQLGAMMMELVNLTEIPKKKDTIEVTEEAEWTRPPDAEVH